LNELIQNVLEWLGISKPPPAPEPKPRPAGKKLVKQVFEGTCPRTPAFAEGVPTADIIAACQQHVACKYTPSFEHQRIYGMGRRDMQGNLPIEYEGIAGSCGATRTFGNEIAKEDGYVQAYRYIDLNHIFACCCGTPEDCRFYLAGQSEQEAVASQQRKLPEQDTPEQA
jgi:hypothetical protein